MANVYTRKGDKGSTGLLGGSRTSKDDLRVESYGTIDEANSMIGVAYSLTNNQDIKKILNSIQQKLFVLGAELASDEKGRGYLKDKVEEKDVKELERIIDEYIDMIGKQKSFVIPGKTTASAVLHVSRTIIRRAERLIVNLAKQTEIRSQVTAYVNRLSDTLFTLARAQETYELINIVKNKVMEKLNINNDRDRLNLEICEKMARAAKEKSKEIGIPIIFSVVDNSGNLMFFERMNDSLLVSIDISINKAYTASALRIPTHEVAEITKPGDELYGIQWTNDSKIVTFGGGYPLKIDNRIVGGIGVSGGSVEEDMSIASYALRVFELERGSI